MDLSSQSQHILNVNTLHIEDQQPSTICEAFLLQELQYQLLRSIHQIIQGFKIRHEHLSVFSILFVVQTFTDLELDDISQQFRNLTASF